MNNATKVLITYSLNFIKVVVKIYVYLTYCKSKRNDLNFEIKVLLLSEKK